MPASYPNSVKIFTTKTTGQTILASHINEPQDEITAIEQGLLQGLAHALFPNTDVGQDLGTTTRRWRQLLVQKIAAGVTNATRLRVQEVGTSTWITVNADFDGTNWNREDTAQPAQAIEINSTKEVRYYRVAAGANPITWTNILTISTDRITAPRAVIGTDPGGTEVLRAQNLRAGATTLTGTLTAPTVVVGTDPGGTEKLRAENLRAGSTTITAGLSVPSSLPSYASDSSVVYSLSPETYADRIAWTSAALHNIFASATNIVVETSDDGTTWTTGNADDFRRIVRRAIPSGVSFTSQYVRFTFDIGAGELGRHIIVSFSGQTSLTRVLRVEQSGDGGSTWTTLINNVMFSGAEQQRIFTTSAQMAGRVRITLWATTWSAGNTHVLLWLCGTSWYPFRSVAGAGKAPRLGQPDGSTRTAIMSNTDVVPMTDNAYDIGTSTLRWRSIYGVSGVFGTDPGGTEVLRAQNIRAGGAIFADMFSNTVVTGIDPGGTESLRAGSARLNAPVLLGSVPQFTMAADPTAALQVATKQYADTKLARGTAETITARHTFNPSTLGAPFLIGANASGQLVTGLNADMVDGLHASDLAASQPPTISIFSSPGTYTWTRPANCKRIWIRCWGGGGGGGGARASVGGEGPVPGYGGGGGGGGYAERLLDVTGISSATVTVGSGGSGGSGTPTNGGSGGSSSFSVGATVYVQANGGSGGVGGLASGGGGGAGGSAISGAGGFAVTGEPGWSGSTVFGGGRGGGSPMGGLGAGVAPGAGGNGAVDSGGTGTAGGAGAAGAVVIFEYY